MTPEGWPVIPMELTICDAPYDAPDTLFQVKWDGVRCLAYAYPDGVRLYNRRLNARTQQYPELVQGLSTLPKGTVLDGEIVALGPDGKPSFPRVLRRDLARSAAKTSVLTSSVPIHYMVFDVLWDAGEPLYPLPLYKRLERLSRIPLASPAFRVDSVPEQGMALFEAARHEGLEGIVAKKADSAYRIGERSLEWQKIKCTRELNCIIGGYIKKPDGMRCVLVGVQEESGLLYIGRASSGPTHKEWAALHARLKALHAPCPFSNPPPAERDAVWVTPTLPIRVRFLEYTKEGVMRAPAILALPEV